MQYLQQQLKGTASCLTEEVQKQPAHNFQVIGTIVEEECCSGFNGPQSEQDTMYLPPSSTSSDLEEEYTNSCTPNERGVVSMTWDQQGCEDSCNDRAEEETTPNKETACTATDIEFLDQMLDFCYI